MANFFLCILLYWLIVGVTCCIVQYCRFKYLDTEEIFSFMLFGGVLVPILLITMLLHKITKTPFTDEELNEEYKKVRQKKNDEMKKYWSEDE